MEALNSLTNGMIDIEHEETNSQELFSEKNKETCYRPISENCFEDNKDLPCSSFSYTRGQFSNSNVNRERRLHVFSRIENCQPMDNNINEMIFLELKNSCLQSLDDSFNKIKTFSFPIFNNDNGNFTENDKKNNILSFYREGSALSFNDEAPITCSNPIMDNPKFIQTTHLHLCKNKDKSDTHLLAPMQNQFKNDIILAFYAKNPTLNVSEISYEIGLISLFKLLKLDSTVRLIFNGPFGCINTYSNRVQKKKSIMKLYNKYNLLVQKNNNLPSFIYLIVESREQIQWLRLNTYKFLQHLSSFISNCFLFFSPHSFSLMPKTMPPANFVPKVFKKENVFNVNMLSKGDVNSFENTTHLNDIIHQQCKISEAEHKSRMILDLRWRKECKLTTQPVLYTPIQTKHILSNLKNYPFSSQAFDNRNMVKKTEPQRLINLNPTILKKKENALKEDKIVNSSIISAISNIENPFYFHNHAPKWQEVTNCTELNENVCSNYPDSSKTSASSNCNVKKYNFLEGESYIEDQCQLKLNSTDQYDEQLVPGQIELSPDNLFENENLYSSSVDQCSTKTTQFGLEKYKLKNVHPNFDLKNVETKSSMIYESENNLEDSASMDVEETQENLNDAIFNEKLMDDTLHKQEKRFSFSRKRNFQSLTQDFKISSTQAFVPFYEPFKKQRTNLNKNNASQNYYETENNLDKDLKSEFSHNLDQLVPNENLSKKDMNNSQVMHLNETDETVANFNTPDKENDVYGGLQICKKSIRLGLSKKINIKKRLHIL